MFLDRFRGFCDGFGGFSEVSVTNPCVCVTYASIMCRAMGHKAGLWGISQANMQNSGPNLFEVGGFKRFGVGQTRNCGANQPNQRPTHGPKGGIGGK